MSNINVLVVRALPHFMVGVITESVAAQPDMDLVRHRPVSVEEADEVRTLIPPSAPCALVLVGRSPESEDLAERWLEERADLVVIHIDVDDDIVRIALRVTQVTLLLDTLRSLVQRRDPESQQRVAHIHLEATAEMDDTGSAAGPVLMNAAVAWVHEIIRDAVEQTPENGDLHGVSLTRKTLLELLDKPARPPSERPQLLKSAEEALEDARARPLKTERLAVADAVFGLTKLEFQLMVLALAPDLDVRYQRCLGFLLDELTRRSGTFGLYSSLLGGTAAVRQALSATGALARWQVFETTPGRQTAADEGLRLDPFLSQWLLGEREALASDPRLRRLMRPVQWAGADLLTRPHEAGRAERLIGRLIVGARGPWVVLNGDDPAGWRGLIELGSSLVGIDPIRIETSRLAGVDSTEVDECAHRFARLARLSGSPLVIDVTGTDGLDDSLQLFFAGVSTASGHSAVICADEAHVIRLLAPAAFDLDTDKPIPTEARVAAVREAARRADVYLSDESASGIAQRYPLPLDALEQGMRLARSRPRSHDADDPLLSRLITAFKEVAAEGVSRLADRIEPVFELDDVVLPVEQRQQLIEIVDNVRHASRVLDDWKFREKLPYGRGVTALFFGPSGTGKTMAAIGIARRLDIQILRFDLSKMVSKFLGETEKNIDRVFTDAERSGAAILIDEADALLGKRSEVKDAHDRYANIEVAYLLQRMEAFDGLAILTTNMRQNLDPAFLRRLRFIIDFPRPDADARERIWRQCLPPASHALDDAAFGLLGRKIDLTGGHIRQITLRAAFIAAAADCPIDLRHIAQAARAEFAKLGMPPVDLDPHARRAA